ncbi:MAG: hypothetical protein JNL83_29080 [Myxococcales bacterium]|nr:hypothetical protein [Myxococcales bacterium]
MVTRIDDDWMGNPSARDPAFRVTEGTRGAPVFVIKAAEAPDPDEWWPLYDAWRRLPDYPPLLTAVGENGEGRLRFAALEWKDPKLPFGPLVARAGIVLTRVLDMARVCLEPDQLGWFTCPEVRLDIFGRPRVWFWPPLHSKAHASRVPPEVVERWPAADERSLVYCVGRALLEATHVTRADLATPLGAVLRRCLVTDPAKRYPTIKQVRTALRPMAPVPYSEARPSEEAIEQGIGYLVLEKWNDAFAVFDAAARLTHETQSLAERGRQVALAHGASFSTPPTALRQAVVITREAFEPKRSWTDLAPTAQRLELDRDPRGALALYQQIKHEEPIRWRLYLALSRCYLALGDTGPAVDYARRALADVPSSREAHMLITKGFLARREYSHAHDALAAWEKLLPDDAAMHYARGKVLLGQHQFADALAAFDKALAKDGTMIEAMLLRREAERHQRRARAEVGTQAQPHVAPELAALIGGDPAAAIAALRAERFATDPVAQLVLAQLLASEQRYAEALEVFVECADKPDVAPRALRGAAAALLELDRAQEALDLLGNATELEALELRVRVLKQLGRTADAEAEQSRLDAKLATLGDVRVRAARGGG